jgi:8-oxo-dGTP pyrophosphatase MutT (NUDIX family)
VSVHPSDGRTAAIAAVSSIVPVDPLEAEHQASTIQWIHDGAAIWRTAKPDVPPQHLVSYFAVVDRPAMQVLLVDHRLAGLWLPTGGHVEPEEDPWQTVVREATEELAIEAVPLPGLSSNPLMVTQTATVGSGVHTDVSLWYVLEGRTDMSISPDPGEFVEARWWPIWTAAVMVRTDPHLSRFQGKFQRELRDHDESNGRREAQ